MKHAILKFLILTFAASSLGGCIGMSDGQETAADFSTTGLSEATFAGGCFWCVDKHFEKVDGVTEAVTGYMGGEGEHKRHEDWKDAGYREVARVYYNPDIVTYRQLADYHLRHIDPLNANGQFCDSGNAYYGTLYYSTPEEKAAAEAAIADAAEVLGEKVVTLVEEATAFFPAAKHHQDYYKKYTWKYNFTVSRCGRDERLQEIWGVK